MEAPKHLNINGGNVYCMEEDKELGQRFGIEITGFPLRDSKSVRKLIEYLQKALLWVDYNEKKEPLSK